MNKFQKYIDIANNEIKNKEFALTNQYLSKHEIVYENDLPKIERIDDESYGDDLIAIYFVLKDVGFFLEIHINKKLLKVDFVRIESGNEIYLTLTSDKYSYRELTQGLNIDGLYGWSKGDLRPDGKSTHTFSRVSFNPIINKAYDFNIKLNLFLDILETKSKEILTLGKKADYIGIEVVQNKFIGNTIIGYGLSQYEINSLSKLNLLINFTLYIEGKMLD